MLSFLSSAGSQLLKNVLPSAINWGVNKLMTSNFGKNYITPHVLQGMGSTVNLMKSYTDTPPLLQQIPEV